MRVEDIDFTKSGGLVPIVVQDAESGAVLMLGYGNEQSVRRTIESGNLCFWSRSRQEYWLKGEKSGNYLTVERLAIDCDGDALLAVVRPATGNTPVCHTGAATCFYRDIEPEA